MAQVVTDKFGRPIRDLRISVTDKCNFRCRSCMPKEIFGDDFEFLKREQLLSFDEIERLARIYASLGVNKLPLTGWEPMMRKDLYDLIERIKGIDAIEDIGLTTNGLLVKKHGQKVYDAGLRRINISLDAMDE